jgi:exoribonuclease II
MHVLFEEGGKFLGGRILSEAEASLQVELDSGKRVKLKTALALLRFEKPSPAELIAQAQALAQSIELDLAWEFAPEDEFSYPELAHEYFSAKASTLELAATLMRLYEAPHYFRRAGKGRFKKASAEVIAQALAAIEKKKQITALIAQWTQELSQGTCPAPIAEQLYKILFKPDKNAPEYKAVVEASRATHTAPLLLLKNVGAIASPYAFHWQRFLYDVFPKGVGFPPLESVQITDELPLASVEAFSIDDSSTTEIDDALSVQGLGTDTITVGIHIAAPALAIKPGSAADAVARARYSTVYMPGNKITMLPDAVVQTYTLGAGSARPAVSLYVAFDAATLALKSSETKLERVPIAQNLRHDQLDAIVTEESLLDTDYFEKNTAMSSYYGHSSLSFLYKLAKHLKAQREVVRGKPENFNRPDYNFKLLDVQGSIQGNETVEISTRMRGAPLDLIVAEAMILANSTWGQWMAALGVPGIYRSQASLAPGVKVRMGTKALPHAGIGVKSYAWSSSPLRRYTDLVNQWQIIACVKHGQTAALAAPFKPKDAELFSIISGFDAAYSAYNGFQNQMERYWTLQYLRQHQITELMVGVVKSEGASVIVRSDTLPLVFPILGAVDIPRGAKLLVKLGEIDDIALELSGTVLERLDASADADSQDAPDDDTDETTASSLHIAMDIEAPDDATEATINSSEAPSIAENQTA